MHTEPRVAIAANIWSVLLTSVVAPMRWLEFRVGRGAELGIVNY
jgi:hypothetical protein